MRFEEIENKFGFYVEHFLDNTAPATSGNYDVIFTAMHPCEVMEIAETHGNGSSSGTVQVEKLLPGVNAGSGLAVSQEMSTASGTVNSNTVYFYHPLNSATNGVPHRQLDKGDRLAIKPNGSLANLKDLHITVYFKPLGRGDFR